MAVKAVGKAIKGPLLKQDGNTIKKPITKTLGNATEKVDQIFFLISLGNWVTELQYPKQYTLI